jgi:hypothetical protein
MRGFGGLAGMIVVAATVTGIEPAGAFCSVFQSLVYIPAFGTPVGQDLRLTVESTAVPASLPRDDNDGSEHKLDTIRAMFAALRACWVPPAKDEALRGMQMTVRFAFRRSGEIIATPRVTYASRGVPPETRETYRNAIAAALDRCTPLNFTDGIAGAIAGKPIAIRFVDNRDLP